MYAMRFNKPLFDKYERLYFKDTFNNDEYEGDNVVVAATVMFLYDQMIRK